MPKAVWNGAVIADSDETVIVEANHYFPRESLVDTHVHHSETTSRCPWKGRAHYLHLEVDGQVNRDAAWYYPKPSVLARRIRGRVAFGDRVDVRP